jgi:hypothetical protein
MGMEVVHGMREGWLHMGTVVMDGAMLYSR